MWQKISYFFIQLTENKFFFHLWSSPQSSDKCPLDKRCLDKISTASTSSEVFNEVYTQSMSLLLGQEPFVGFLVVVVWLDVVGANLVPVQYQT